MTTRTDALNEAIRAIELAMRSYEDAHGIDPQDALNRRSETAINSAYYDGLHDARNMIERLITGEVT